MLKMKAPMKMDRAFCDTSSATTSLKERGVAVIYVGEDLDVLLELADRILVLCGGKVSGIVPGRGATKRDVGMMMTQLGGNEAHA